MWERERQGDGRFDRLYAAAVGAQRPPQGFSPTRPFALLGAPPPPLVSTGLETHGGLVLGAGHIRRGQRVTQVPSLSGCAGLVLMHDFPGQGPRQRRRGSGKVVAGKKF